MGITISAHWKGQTEEERSARALAVFARDFSSLGYLYHWPAGEHSVSRFLFAEAFTTDPPAPVQISAEVLRARLAPTFELATTRGRMLLGLNEVDIEVGCQAYENFVDLCERKEKETGEPVTILPDMSE